MSFHTSPLEKHQSLNCIALWWCYCTLRISFCFLKFNFYSHQCMIFFFLTINIFQKCQGILDILLCACVHVCVYAPHTYLFLSAIIFGTVNPISNSFQSCNKLSQDIISGNKYERKRAWFHNPDVIPFLSYFTPLSHYNPSSLFLSLFVSNSVSEQLFPSYKCTLAFSKTSIFQTHEYTFSQALLDPMEHVVFCFPVGVRSTAFPAD